MDVARKIVEGAYLNQMEHRSEGSFLTYDDYREHRRKYRVEDNRLKLLFQSDLEKEFELENHPKRNLLFSKAWDLGHSAGYMEVWSYYSDLVELLK